MASVPGAGPGAGTAAVLGAKIVHGAFGVVAGVMRGTAAALMSAAGVLTGIAVLGSGMRLEEADPLHPFEQRTFDA